jgi:hypothetical protein
MVSQMLKLPKSTELNKFLPKKTIYEKFMLNTQEKDRFDSDVKKIVIINEISPITINIPKGDQVDSIFVMHVQLKKEMFNDKNIILISKLIDQKMIFLLEYMEQVKLAIYHHKLLQSSWASKEDTQIEIKGLSLDDVWESLIVKVSGIELKNNKSIDEQIKLNETKVRLEKQIDSIERQARSEKQPKKKFELVEHLNRLKMEMERLN